MPHVSRNRLSKKIEQELTGKLNQVLTILNSSDEMFAFLEALLTETERLMLAKRLATIILLNEGLPDSQIAEILHITRITVAKMRYYNKARGQGFNIALAKLEKQKQFFVFKKMLLSLARYSIRTAGGRVKPTLLD